MTLLLAVVALALPLGASAGSDTTPPTTPTGLYVSDVTTSTFTLSWQPSTDNREVTAYRIFWLDTSSPGSSQTPPWPDGTPHGVTGATTIAVTGLTCGKTYVVGVSAIDAAGNESETANALVATFPCVDVSPPTPPSQLAQIASTETSATIAWAASQDNFGVAGYRIYVAGLEVGQTPGTSYTFAGLTCGTNTSVAVEAYDAAGNRSAQSGFVVSTKACAAPPPPPPPPPPPSDDRISPTTPGNLRVTATTESSVTVAWSASTDNVGVVGYGAYRNGVREAETSQTSYTFTALQCGSSTTVWIDAYDAALNRSAEATAIVSTKPCTDTVRPAHPEELFRTSATQTSISFRWSSATDNVAVVGYGIYKDGATVAQTSATDYTLTGLTCGRGYTIGVDAYDPSGNRSFVISALMATSACGDGQAPSSPTGLKTSAITATSAALVWTPSVDNVGVAGYEVFADGAQVATTTATMYAFTGLSCGATHTVGVAAFDVAGNRSTRASVSVTMAACSSPSGPSASLYISPSGNDSGSCTQAAPCRTFDRAYRAAAPGQAVGVKAGTYPQTDSLYEAVRIDPDATKTSPDDVTFVCADGDSGTVTNASKFFQVRAQHLSFVGGCFHFHGLLIGRGDDKGVVADDVTFDGVHTDYFDAAGPQNLTIRNSEIGPMMACWSPNDTSKPAYERCQDNAATGEKHYYDLGTATNVYSEPKVRGNADGVQPRNVTLEGNWFHDMQSRDLVGAHNGGFMYEAGGSSNFVMRGNVFERNVAYDVLFEFAPNDVTIENNWFGAPWDGINYSYRPMYDYYAVGTKSSGASNWLVRFNSIQTRFKFANGSGGFNNLRFIGNIVGSSYCESGMGTWDSNVFVGGTCGSNSRSVPSLPFVSTSGSIDFHLTGGLAVDLVTWSGSDYALGTDFDGQSRPLGLGRDAGADEVR